MNIKQKDKHAAKYSSTKIIGNVNGTLTLISKNSQYHPRHKFKLLRTEGAAETAAETAAAVTPSINVPENQSEQSNSGGDTNNQVAAVVPKPVENTSSSISVSSNNESVSVSSSSTYTKWRGAQSVEQAQQFANEIQASIVMFMAISEVIENSPSP